MPPSKCCTSTNKSTHKFSAKKQARAVHERSKVAKKLRGHKAKLYHKKRYSEKVSCHKPAIACKFLHISL